jgi:uncharacterized protein YcbX
VVVPFDVSRSPRDFLHLLVEEQVTVLNQTPSAFYELIQADADDPATGGRLSLRWVVFGGEALDAGRLDGWFARHPADDPALVNVLLSEIDQKHQLTLMRSHRAMTDCRPVSIFSLQSARQLSEETETPIDKRRFRANVYLDLASDRGFGENELVGCSLKIGPKVIVRVLERDARCAMITLDPDTAERTPAVLKKVAQAHQGTAGVYGAVIVEGMLHKGDSVELLD